MTIRLILFVCVLIFLKVINLEEIAEKDQIVAIFIVILCVFFALYLIFKILHEIINIKKEIHDSVKKEKD
mgnify:CR=1